MGAVSEMLPTADREALIACLKQHEPLTRGQRDYLLRSAASAYTDLRNDLVAVVRTALGADRSPERDVARRKLNLPLDEQHWGTAKAEHPDWFGWSHWTLTRGRWVAHGLVGIACYRLLTVPPPTLRWWALLLGMVALNALMLRTMMNVAGGSEKEWMEGDFQRQWSETILKVYFGFLAVELAAAWYVLQFVAHGHRPIL
jgi:hypothetical protein